MIFIALKYWGFVVSDPGAAPCTHLDLYTQMSVGNFPGSTLTCHMSNIKKDTSKSQRDYTLYAAYLCGPFAVLSCHTLALTWSGYLLWHD